MVQAVVTAIEAVYVLCAAQHNANTMTEARCLQYSGELMHGTICAAMLTTRRAVCNRQALTTLTSLRGPRQSRGAH